jgi:predicted Zn-dependent protease
MPTPLILFVQRLLDVPCTDHRALAICLAFCFAAAGIGAGCATTQGAGNAAAEGAADVLLPPREEEKLGERFSKNIESELKLHPDEQVQAYLQTMGQQVLKAAGNDAHQAIKFEFHVVDDPDTINAFAGPGGQIYFYSGLLKQADTKAEVMSVMAHEVAHVTERHVAERMVASYGIEALMSAAVGDNPGLLARLATSLAAQGFLLKYSRDQETEADRTGLKYIIGSGYDPNGFISFFQKIKQQGGSPPVFMSSHPLPQQRIDNVQKILNSQSQLPSKSGRDEHQQILNKL